MSMVLSGMSKLESYEVVVVLAVQEKPSAVHIVPEPNGPAFSAQIYFNKLCILIYFEMQSIDLFYQKINL